MDPSYTLSTKCSLCQWEKVIGQMKLDTESDAFPAGKRISQVAMLKIYFFIRLHKLNLFSYGH